MAERNWTKPQRDAMDARGGTVLVSAAAGSGKTAVLVERVVGLLCDEQNPVPADRLLVATFTNAAAAEMKQRLGQRVAQLLRRRPGDAHLQRQQALLGNARISTIHSFCLDLVRGHFQDLNITPDFVIADQQELDILMQDAAGDTIAHFYEEDASGAFLELVELLSTGRDDRKLQETILRVYTFCRSHPFPERWLDRTLELYATDQPVAGTIWGAVLLRYAADSLDHCAATQRQTLAVAEADEKMAAAYGSALRGDIAALEWCLSLAVAGRWDETVAALGSFRFEALGRLVGASPQKARVQHARDRVKKTVKRLAERVLNATEADFREDLADLAPKIQVLFQMVRDFGDRLDAAKAAKKRLDFSDLEHLALRLLARPTEEGFVPTSRALELAGDFDCVLVDEYQDTNEVQDTIFACISQNRENLFLVGDVKQSIYSFRQAMPELFMEKQRAFAPYNGVDYPAKIFLDTNFRSRAQVTAAVNFLFGRLMSQRLGEVEYEGRERLQCGAVYPEGPDNRPELLLVDAGEYAGEKSPRELEAAAIAQRIQELLREGYTVREGDKQRPARLRDFCILLRSVRDKAGVYVKELVAQGIPAWAENAGGFLVAREVGAVVSMLRAMDNPLLDVELVAALLSPLFDFTADDVAEIRLGGGGEPYYRAVCRAAEGGNAKAERFLRIFHTLRREAAVRSADRLLLRLYQETDILAVAQAMPLGASRRANLLLLVEYAGMYHKLGYKKLGGFVGFLGRLEERGGDLPPANTMGGAADVVRVMSIHKSKGLEFPVVFLADCAKKFNAEDQRSGTLLHARFGFACVRRDNTQRKQYPTVPLQALRLECQRSQLSEEMRILYVALTRAMEKLVLCGAVKTGIGKKLAAMTVDMDGDRLPAHAVGEASCYLDWALMALLHHPSAQALRGAAGLEDLELLEDHNPWAVRICMPEEAGSGAQKTEITRTATPDKTVERVLRERADWSYPHIAQTRTPAKLAVSSVAKGRVDAGYRFAARPRFLSGAELTPAQRGNAMHKFMQFADYQSAKEDLAREIERMRAERYLTAAEAGSLSRARLRKFFYSALANRIFASEQVWRELKFTAECGKDMLGEWILDMDDESRVVLQGVADCVFLEDGGAVIVDYKTDRVETGEELLERYSAQLWLYREILGQSLEAPVKECVLYSFALGRTVTLK